MTGPRYNPDSFIYRTITEEELKTWESGKWKGARYNQTWLREVKLPEIRSRPAQQRNILDTDLCVCGLTEEQCNAQKATIRNQTLKEIAIELQEIVDVMGTENPVSQAYLAVINMTRLKREAQSLRTQEPNRGDQR